MLVKLLLPVSFKHFCVYLSFINIIHWVYRSSFGFSHKLNPVEKYSSCLFVCLFFVLESALPSFLSGNFDGYGILGRLHFFPQNCVNLMTLSHSLHDFSWEFGYQLKWDITICNLLFYLVTLRLFVLHSWQLDFIIELTWLNQI